MKPINKVLKSSLICKVVYEPYEYLEIEFNNGAVYQYYDTPYEVVEELVEAPSAGKYFNENRQYFKRCKRVF